MAGPPGEELDSGAVLGGRRARRERQLNVLADVGLTPSLGPSLWSAANGYAPRRRVLLRRPGEGLARRPGRDGTAIAFPLICRNRTVGALVGLDPAAVRSAPSLGRRSSSRLRLLLEPSAIALDNALALQRAEALSVTDDLTRLSNSRYLNQVLRRETKRASRSGRPLSLLFLDLDGFKRSTTPTATWRAARRWSRRRP